MKNTEGSNRKKFMKYAWKKVTKGQKNGTYLFLYYPHHPHYALILTSTFNERIPFPPAEMNFLLRHHLDYTKSWIESYS